MHHMMPPPPNRDIVPFHLQQAPLVQISDIRGSGSPKTRQGRSFAEYIIIRLEKIQEEYDYTDERGAQEIDMGPGGPPRSA